MHKDKEGEGFPVCGYAECIHDKAAPELANMDNLTLEYYMWPILPP
jgi:hypothetical protein